MWRAVVADIMPSQEHQKPLSSVVCRSTCVVHVFGASPGNEVLHVAGLVVMLSQPALDQRHLPDPGYQGRQPDRAGKELA